MENNELQKQDGDGGGGGDREGFATYTRDQGTGLDYADQRWYASGLGRFLTSDLKASGKSVNNASKPITFNSYMYSLASPNNYFDRRGTEPFCDDSENWDEEGFRASAPDHCFPGLPSDPCVLNGDCDPSPGSPMGGGDGEGAQAVSKAKAAASTFSKNALTCGDLFDKLNKNKLGKAAGNVNVGAIGTNTTFTQSTFSAAAAASQNYIYDGTTSSETYAFAVTGTSLGTTQTIASYLASTSGRGTDAFSQFNGLSIYLNPNSSQYPTSDVGVQTLVLHELLHKFFGSDLHGILADVFNSATNADLYFQKNCFNWK